MTIFDLLSTVSFALLGMGLANVEANDELPNFVSKSFSCYLFNLQNGSLKLFDVLFDFRLPATQTILKTVSINKF